LTTIDLRSLLKMENLTTFDGETPEERTDFQQIFFAQNDFLTSRPADEVTLSSQRESNLFSGAEQGLGLLA